MGIGPPPPAKSALPCIVTCGGIGIGPPPPAKLALFVAAKQLEPAITSNITLVAFLICLSSNCLSSDCLSSENCLKLPIEYRRNRCTPQEMRVAAELEANDHSLRPGWHFVLLAQPEKTTSQTSEINALTPGYALTFYTVRPL